MRGWFLARSRLQKNTSEPRFYTRERWLIVAIAGDQTAIISTGRGHRFRVEMSLTTRQPPSSQTESRGFHKPAARVKVSNEVFGERRLWERNAWNERETYG